MPPAPQEWLSHSTVPNPFTQADFPNYHRTTLEWVVLEWNLKLISFHSFPTFHYPRLLQNLFQPAVGQFQGTLSPICPHPNPSVTPK